MSGRARPVLVAVAGLAVVASLAGVGCRRSSPRGGAAASFEASEVATDSPGIAVEVSSVRGVLHEGYMEWACALRCQEPEGCSAELRLTVHYTSDGSPESIIFSGPIDVPVGARARIGGVQRAPRRVDRVDRVEVAVERRITPGEPVPTPEY